MGFRSVTQRRKPSYNIKMPSGTNPLVQLAKQQQLMNMKLMSELEQKRGAVQAAPDVINQVKEISGGQVPVDTKMNLDTEAGSVSVPLNRKLSGDEISALAAEQVFVPQGRAIQADVKYPASGESNVFEPSLFKGVPIAGNMERTYKQWAVGQPNALFTSYDKNLQELQGKINSVRRYVFGEGGKQLTPYEANLVNALINPLGKNDNQYVRDIDRALKIIESKARLVREGVTQNMFEDMSVEEQYNQLRDAGVTKQQASKLLGL